MDLYPWFVHGLLSTEVHGVQPREELAHYRGLVEQLERPNGWANIYTWIKGKKGVESGILKIETYIFAAVQWGPVPRHRNYLWDACNGLEFLKPFNF